MYKYIQLHSQSTKVNRRGATDDVQRVQGLMHSAWSVPLQQTLVRWRQVLTTYDEVSASSPAVNGKLLMERSCRVPKSLCQYTHLEHITHYNIVNKEQPWL